MSSRVDRAAVTRPVLEWYRRDVRPLLEQHAPSKAADLDDDAQRIEKLAALLDEELAVCFLGESGVGKSTLINAIVAGPGSVLPSGGVGPLTALAMEVRHGDRPAFDVKYHLPARLWQTVFALERAHARELASSQAQHASEEAASEKPIIDGLVEAEEEVEAEEQSGDGRERLHKYGKQAQLMVTGNQDGDRERPYLLDSLRSVLGMKRRWGTPPLDIDEPRLARIRAVLELAKGDREYRLDGAEEDSRFRGELNDHAAGFLAPLIRELDVHWNSSLLKAGVTLVDLPGLGGAVDVFKEETVKWVRERAKAIVLVVDRVGITEASARLLRESGFLTRLLFSIDDPTADPVILMIAVVQIDNIAKEHWRADRSKSKVAHFADLQARMIPVIHNQLREQLETVWASENRDGPALTEGKAEVIERVLKYVQVYPLSATEYRMSLADDPEDRPFLPDAEHSGVPNLYDAIRAVVDARRLDAQARVARAMEVLFGRSVAALQLVRAQWAGQTRAAEESARLATELEEFLRPLREEFSTRKGMFREFLKNGIPNRIEKLIKEARDSAREEFRGYLLRRLPADTHWATLRALVRKQGRHSGVRGEIDLPGEFARRFEEPIAEVWSKDILKAIRQRTREFADDCVATVDEIVKWAKRKESRVQPALVEAIEDDIRGDIKKIDALGKEVINDLREKVKQRLLRTLEKSIERGCKEFVSRGEDQGTGTKMRIREKLLPILANDAANAAVEPGTKILVESYEQVREELLSTLRYLDNPISSASSQILDAHRQRLEKSDSKKREQVLGDVDRAIGSAPSGFTSTPGVSA